MMILQFGAGNIGRGFMGHLFHEAGYKVVFVESNEELAHLLNRRKIYPLRILDAYKREIIDFVITDICAIYSIEKERIAVAFEEAQCVGTAVGISSYQAIAPLLAAGIRRRREKRLGPIDCYLCENDLTAHIKLKNAVWLHFDPIDQKWAEENVGFVRVSVARMVPGQRKDVGDPLLVVADAHREFPYDEKARKASPPHLPTAKAIKHFEAEFQRKIYTYNLGHAVLAYLGYLRGYQYVHEGFNDTWISNVFDGALGETAQALFQKYPKVFTPEEHAHVLKDVHVRFGNPLLQDPIVRVARDPIRKLGPSDRLIGSATFCLEQGVFPKNIALACAAALLYDYPGDPAARTLQEKLQKRGIKEVLQEVSSIPPQSPLGKRIQEEYYKLKMLRKG
ncbi:mannitol-1-phosphate 5-dehydrogenase [Atrimonas thermophila]|uniref:mannitol dehydrogenase family protein n=1 Tax=Atrimonas thermophila TaxID=3064161 RepID=UPI00399D042C